MTSHRRLVTAAAAVLALLLAAAPAAAYVIYLKDGSKLVAREKYEVIDGTAYIVLNNGTRTSIDASELDIPRTEEANLRQLGSALVLEDGQVRQMTADETRRPQRRKTLADLIAAREAAPTPRELPEARRSTAGEEELVLPITDAGYPDLAALPPRPLADLEVEGELRQLYSAQGLDEVEVTRGSREGRPLVRVVTPSEASAFRAVAVACAAVLRLTDSHPEQVEALELVMSTPSRERAGQFVIEPGMASELMAREVDMATFFIAHVQF